MKRKIIMTIVLTLSLLMMFFPWFGGAEGIQEVYGLVLLKNPVSLTCLLLISIGIWTDCGKNSEVIGVIGFCGVLVMQIYEFLTWHILTITGHFDLELSMRLSHKEFYIALACIVICLAIYRKIFIRYTDE